MKLSKLYFMENRYSQIWLPIILTMFIAISPRDLPAQKLDSLKAQLKLDRGAARCSTLFRIAFELSKGDDKSTIDYASKAFECAKAHGDTLLMIKAARIKALGFRLTDQIDSSNALIFSILPMARSKQDYGELKYLTHALAIGLFLVSRYDEALRYNFEALEIRRKYAKPSFVAATLNNIGLVYYKLRDYSKAVEYYTYSLNEYASEAGNDELVNSERVNMSLGYAYLGQLDRADSIISVFRHGCGNSCPPSDLINVEFCRGVVELSRLDTANAKVHFLESYKRAKEFNHKRLELDNIVYLSQICLGTNEISEAAYYLDEAEKLIQTGIPYNMELMKVYKEFARLYERKGDYRRVAEFQRRYIAFRDSTQNEEMTIGLMQIEAKHIEEAKNAEIETQSKMLELNKEIILRQKIATIFAFSTVALLAGYAVLLIRNIREKKNRNIDLEKRVKNRTVELESIARQAQKALSEKNLWIGKILYSVKHTANTVNGLSALVGKDSDSRDSCAFLITKEMSRLVAEVNTYVSKSDYQLNGTLKDALK